MAYGQKNYLEIQGINGKYRISQIGCFLTSFCNLLERFGKGVSPVDLNFAFKNAGVYIDVDDGIRDDLAWSSISKFNPNIVVTRTGIGAPSSNNVIVKFSGVNNPFGTHFCLVADHSKGLIVDSWDGQVKHWNTYGGPKSWAEYKDNTPKPVQAPTPVPTPVSNANVSDITVQKGWGLSHIARNAGFADWDNEARWAAIASLNGSNDWRAFNKSLKVGQKIVVKINSTPAPQQATEQPKASEVVNITIQAGWGLSHALKAAGYTKEQWENPAEWQRVAELNGSPAGLKLKPNQVIKVYTQALPINQPAPAPQAPVVPVPEKVEAVAPVTPAQAPAVTEEKIEVKVIPTDPKAYQATFTPEDRVYIAQQSIIVKDMEGLHMDRQLVKGQKVNSGGRFTRSEVTYIRTKRSIADNVWYGVPESALSKGQDPNAYVGPLTDNEDDDSLFDLDMATEARELLNKLSGREKVVAFLAKVQGVFIRLAQTLKLKKKEK